MDRQEESRDAKYPSRAIVVVHGIGMQARDNTRNLLASAFVQEGATLGGFVHGDPVELREPVPPVARRVTKDDVVADVYEIYWAPLTSHKTKTRSVLAWLLRNTFLPGDALRRPGRKTMLDILQIGFLSVAASAIILLSLSTLGSLTGQAATEAKRAQAASTPCSTVSLRGRCLTWGGFRQFADAGHLLSRAVRFADFRIKDLSPSNGARVLKEIKLYTWLILIAVTWLSVQILYRLLQLFKGEHLVEQVVTLLGQLGLVAFAAQLVPPVLIAFVWVLTLTGGLTRVTSTFIAESIGDVQIYVNRDENDAHFAARAAILDEANHVFGTLADRGYEEIVVFGHSLGSVIAFDALDTLRFHTPAMLSRVKAFVTYGSAIEKVRYFFDKQVPGSEERPLRAASALIEIAVGRAWINLWHWTDVIANPILSIREPTLEPISRRGTGTEDANALIVEARPASVLNLSYRRLTPPWPPIHSYYLKDPKIRPVIAGIAFSTAL